MRNWSVDDPVRDAEDAAEDTRPIKGYCEYCGDEIHGGDVTHYGDEAYDFDGVLVCEDCLSIYTNEHKIKED